MERDVNNIEWWRQDNKEHDCNTLIDAPIGKTIYVTNWSIRRRNEKYVIPIVTPYRDYIKPGSTIHCPVLRTEKGFKVSRQDMWEDNRLAQYDFAILDTFDVEIV